MSPKPGRLGILTVMARKGVASPYRALTFSGRLELCIAAGGHIRFGIIRDKAIKATPRRMSALPPKADCATCLGMPALCQKRTFALQQILTRSLRRRAARAAKDLEA